MSYDCRIISESNVYVIFYNGLHSQQVETEFNQKSLMKKLAQQKFQVQGLV